MAANMVQTQLRRRGIRDPRALDAMLRIPREEFVPAKFRNRAYDDEPLSIGYGQTITQPYMTAEMAELLELKGTEKVLDVGSGSGYHAAVLGALARTVISIERIPGLAATSAGKSCGARGSIRISQCCAETDRWEFPRRARLTRSQWRRDRRMCLTHWSSSWVIRVFW